MAVMSKEHSSAPIRSVCISGATGWLGMCTAQGFLYSKHDYSVTLLAREMSVQSPAKQAILSVLEGHGARTVLVPDAGYNVEGLTAVLKGIDLVISAVGHLQSALDSQYVLLKAAKRAGVKRFIPSNFGLDLNRIPHGVSMMYDNKRAFQDALIRSGVEYTVICCGCLYETFFTPFFSFDPFKKKVALKGSLEDEFWATSVRDVVRWLPDIVRSPASRNAKVNLVGEVISWRQALHTFEQAAGAKFTVVHKPRDELVSDVRRQGDCWAAFPDRVALCITQGWFLPDGQQAWNHAHGRRALSLESFARQLLSHRLPLLARAVLAGAETPVTPTGQQSARTTNPVLIEAALSDGFPLPLCLPLADAEAAQRPEQ